MVDIVNNTALHLKAWQTPSTDELAEKGMKLLTHYASLVTEDAEQFKAFPNYVVADAYFSKRPVVEAVQSSGLEFTSRLRDDSVLKYKFTGAPTGKNGAPKSSMVFSMLKTLILIDFRWNCLTRRLQSTP